MKVRGELNKKNFDKKMNALMKRSKSVSVFLQRAIYPRYQQAQRDRWKTENASEGATWKPLSTEYAKAKKKLFAAYPGKGENIMVATSKLYFAATGQGPGLIKAFTDRKMVVSIQLGVIPYAESAGKVRPFMRFSQQRIKEWRGLVIRYISGLGAE